MARILLIEDSDPVRSLLRDALELAGHTVIEARNGNEGLALFPHSAVDLVITDMVMPAMEGFEVLRVLRQIHPPVKIIAISGADLWENHLRMASHLGATTVLAKPFPPDVLVAAVVALLSGGGAPEPPPVSR